jgi:hypothetical protein
VRLHDVCAVVDLVCDVLAVMLEELQQSRTTIAGARVPYTIDVVSVIIKITADPTFSVIKCITEAAVTFVVLLPNSKVHPRTIESYRICISKHQRFFNAPSHRAI